MIFYHAKEVDRVYFRQIKSVQQHHIDLTHCVTYSYLAPSGALRVYHTAGDQSLVSWETVPFPSGYNHADECWFLYRALQAITILV
jgi:hypothetical protein